MCQSYTRPVIINLIKTKDNDYPRIIAFGACGPFSNSLLYKWRVECVITKTYKLTHFTYKFRSCMNKSYHNEKLFSSRTNRIVIHLDGRCLVKSDCIAKNCLLEQLSYRNEKLLSTAVQIIS